MRAVALTLASAVPATLLVMALLYRGAGWPAAVAFCLALLAIAVAALFAEHHRAALATLLMMLALPVAIPAVYEITRATCQRGGYGLVYSSLRWLIAGGIAYVTASTVLLAMRPGRYREWSLALAVGVATAAAILNSDDHCAYDS
jgi:hypothetical protein